MGKWWINKQCFFGGATGWHEWRNSNMALYFLWWPVWCQMSMRNTTKQLAMSTGKINADKTWESNMVKAPVGRPRFLRYLYVTLILFSIHIPLFTVFLVHAIFKCFAWKRQKCCRRASFFQNLVFGYSENVISDETFLSKTSSHAHTCFAKLLFSLLACLLLVISSNPRRHSLWTSKLLNFLKHRILHSRSCVSSTTSIHSAASASAWHPGTQLSSTQSARQSSFEWIPNSV